MHESAPALRISLAPHVNAPNQARRHLLAMLRGRLPDLLEQRALLLVSELATVAVLHRRRSAIAVWISTTPPRLRAEVTEIADPTSVAQRVHPAGGPLDDVQQSVALALQLVDAFSTSWGPLAHSGHWFEVEE